MLPALHYNEFLGAFDASYMDLHADPTRNVCVGSVWRFENAPSARRVAEEFARFTRQTARLRERPVPAPLPGLPWRWEADPNFDQRRHGRAVDLGGDSDLVAAWQLVSEAYSRPISARHPMWEWFFVSGVRGGAGLLLIKVHHVYGDGMSLQLMLATMLMRAPAAELDRPPLVHAPVRHVLRGVRQAGVTGVRSAASLLDELGRCTRSKAARRALGDDVRRFVAYTRAARSRRRQLPARTPQRRLFARCIALEDLRRAAEQQGLSLTDLLTRSVARTVSRYYAAAGYAHDDIYVTLPVNIRPKQATQTVDNELELACVRFSASEAGPEHAKAAVARALREKGRQVPPCFARLLELSPAPVKRWYTLNGDLIADAVASILPAAPRLAFAGESVSESYLLPAAIGSTAAFGFQTYRKHVHVASIISDGIVSDAGLFMQLFDEELMNTNWRAQT